MRDLNIEQKMSLREKQKAKKRAEDQEERIFYEQTGIKDKSREYTMDNLIKKYEFDMQRHEKKLAKMKELESKGVSNYDIDEIKLSDDEKEGDYIERLAEERIKKAKVYDDDPLPSKEEQSKNFQAQQDHIEKRLSELQGKVDGTKMTKESDYFKEYESLMNQMHNLHERLDESQHIEESDQLRRDEMKQFERLHQQDRIIKDSFYQKKDVKERLKKTGGAKSQSPVWQDGDE